MERDTMGIQMLELAGIDSKTTILTTFMETTSEMLESMMSKENGTYVVNLNKH